jgi:hypothetical protein
LLIGVLLFLSLFSFLLCIQVVGGASVYWRQNPSPQERQEGQREGEKERKGK